MSAIASVASSNVVWQASESPGVSGAAQDIRQAFTEPSQSPSALATDLQRIETPLVKALIEAEMSGVSVNGACLSHALRFALALPTSWPIPEIVVESDGDIAFDWDFGRRRVMSVAVAPDGRAGFSALIDHEPAFGKVLLTGSVPGIVDFLMTRILKPAYQAL